MCYGLQTPDQGLNGPLVIPVIAKGLPLVSKDSWCWFSAFVDRSSLPGQIRSGQAQILDKVMGSLRILLKGHFNYKAGCLSPGLQTHLLIGSLP